MAVRKRIWTSGGKKKSAWVVDYFDREGNRRRETYPTKGMASDREAEIKGEKKKGTHIAYSESPTVGEAADFWLEHCRAAGLEKSTIRQREQHIKYHIKPHIGSVKLADLNKPAVNRYLDMLMKKGISVAMRRKVLTNLTSIISHAENRGLAAFNGARGIRIKSNREENPKRLEGIHYPSKSELQAMLANATGRWRPFIVTAIFTGMRASELRGLTWENVDVEGGQIHVRQRADAWGEMGRPKSRAGTRSIPIPSIVVNTLQEWKLVCPKHGVEKDADGNVTNPGKLWLVFPNTLGNVEHQANIWKRGFSPLQVKCGITREAMGKDGNPILKNDEPVIVGKYGLRALRHAAASLFIEHWQPKQVQDLMGHASLQMTMDLYGHLFADPEGDQEKASRIEASLVG